MRTILRIIVLILALLLIPPYGYSCYLIAQKLNLHTENSYYFFGGIAVFAILWVVGFRKLRFFQTFEHEMTHMLVGLLFFIPPSQFAVDKDEGGVVQYDQKINFIVYLAPYFLPTFTLLSLPLFLIIQPQYLKYMYAVMGVTTSYHILSTPGEWSLKQPDIQICGRFFSIVIILIGNILTYGFLLGFLVGEFRGGYEFLKQGIQLLYEWGRLLYTQIRNYNIPSF